MEVGFLPVFLEKILKSDRIPVFQAEIDSVFFIHSALSPHLTDVSITI